MLLILFNVTKKIIRLKTSISNKIMIYNIFLDDVIYDLDTKI